MQAGWLWYIAEAVHRPWLDPIVPGLGHVPEADSFLSLFIHIACRLWGADAGALPMMP